MDETLFNFDIIPATTITRKGSRTVSVENGHEVKRGRVAVAESCIRIWGENSTVTKEVILRTFNSIGYSIDVSNDPIQNTHNPPVVIRLPNIFRQR
jgi:hypothetical protein